MWWPALHTTVQLKYSVSEGTLLPPSLFLIFSLDIAFFSKLSFAYPRQLFDCTSFTLSLLSASESSVYVCGVSACESVLKLTCHFLKYHCKSMLENVFVCTICISQRVFVLMTGTVFRSTVERDQGQSIYTMHVLSDLWNVNSCECSYRWVTREIKHCI